MDINKNTILIVEDSPAQLTIYTKALETLNAEILQAKDGKEALDTIKTQKITLVICDLYLPDMTAYDILEDTYKDDKFKSLPFVIMTGKYTDDDLKKLLEKGANDFLRKPFSVIEFLARIKTQLRLKNAFDEQKRLNNMLSFLNEKLEELSIKDELTGIYNRRFLIEFLEKQIQKANRYNNKFSLLLFDIDNFKKINDIYGHLTGDAVIKHVTSLIALNIRESDIIGRFGGEEFVVILLESDIIGGASAGEKLRSVIENTPLILEGNSLNVTVSVGVSEHENGIDVDNVIEKADVALYKAKNSGKNKVEINR
jgi:diguanylate cyclase (GGDEF)-like protein